MTLTSTGKSLSLRANFSWTFAGNIVYAASQWGILIVLAKLGTPEMVGTFALGLAVTAPVVMLTNLQLRGVQATDARQEFAFGDYLSLRLVCSLLAMVIMVAIVAVARYPLESTYVILAIGFAKICESLSDVFYGLLQQHERMDRIASSMMIKGVLSLTALALGVYLTGSVFWGATGLAVVWALLLVLYDIPSGRLVESAPLRLSWNAQRILRLTWVALPLGLVMMLLSLTTNVPRYIIEQSRGSYELGIFAALSYVIMAGMTVVSALGQSASPRLAKHYAQKNADLFRSLLLRLVGVGVALGGAALVITILAGPLVLRWLYSAAYAAYSDVLLWLVVAAAVSFIASFLGYGMTAARYFRPQLPLFVVVASVTLLAGLWLIPTYGLMGAAVTVLVSSVVQLLGTCVVVAVALRSIQ